MPNFHAMFVPTEPILEVIARATIMYLLLFAAMRFLLKREGGALNIADLLVVVAIVDGAQPAFNGNAESITESAIFVVTVIFWSYALNWINYHIPALRFLTAAPPTPLVKDGQLCRKNMHQMLITREELDQQLREAGIDDVRQVRLAMMEGDGTVSIIQYEQGQSGGGSGSGSKAASA